MNSNSMVNILLKSLIRSKTFNMNAAQKEKYIEEECWRLYHTLDAKQSSDFTHARYGMPLDYSVELPILIEYINNTKKYGDAAASTLELL